MSDPALLRRVWSDRQLRARLAADEANSGSPIVRKFPFAFDTPSLVTGAAVYTPTIGDLLFDAWVEIDTPWNGTTPQGDVGTIATDFGWFNDANGLPVDMTIADDPNYWWTGKLLAQGQTNATNNDQAPVSSLSLALMLRMARSASSALSNGKALLSRGLPAKFVSADPIEVIVNSTGFRGDPDSGSTQGAAVLYLVTATPV